MHHPASHGAPQGGNGDAGLYFRGGDVYMDVRTDRGCPYEWPSFAQRLDSDELVRAKSDEELVALERLSRDTYKRRTTERHDRTGLKRGGLPACERLPSCQGVRRARTSRRPRPLLGPHPGGGQELSGRRASTAPTAACRAEHGIRGRGRGPQPRLPVAHGRGQGRVRRRRARHRIRQPREPSLERLRDYDFVTIGAAVGDHNETVVYRSTGPSARRPPRRPSRPPRARPAARPARPALPSAETPSYADAPSQVHRRAFSILKTPSPPPPSGGSERFEA